MHTFWQRPRKASAAMRSAVKQLEKLGFQKSEYNSWWWVFYHDPDGPNHFIVTAQFDEGSTTVYCTPQSHSQAHELSAQACKIVVKTEETQKEKSKNHA